jgi:hypothetical protein
LSLSLNNPSRAGSIVLGRRGWKGERCVSWHYLQGQEEASSEAICWGGEQFAPSKLKSTLGAYCLPGNETESCPDSQSGMTLQRSTDTNGEAVLMWYQGDSPVRTYQPPEKAQESTAHDLDCGPSLPGSWAKYNPHTYSWKTRQCSLLGDLEEFSETFPNWGMMRNGELFLRQTAALGTREKGSGFWLPTIVKSEYKGCDRKRFLTSLYFRGAKMLEGLRTCEDDPQYLNPLFAEAVMGWPTNWTDLQPLGMAKFQLWRQQHSESLRRD